MRNSLWASMLLSAGLLFARNADACTCGDDLSVREALAESSEVFLAQAVHVTHMAVPGDPDHGWSYLEIGAFRVAEVWKGPLRSGAIIQALGWNGPGGCGLQIGDYPRAPFALGQQARAARVSAPGLWIIYRRGTEPYRLSACDRTARVKSAIDGDSIDLRKLVKQ
jgi:hypothetical protein